MSKDKIKKEDVLKDGGDEVLMEYLAQANSFEYNMDKAIEEALEFAEALVKYKTKHKDNPKRPKLSDIVDEFGDLLLRGGVALAMLFQEEIDEDSEYLGRVLGERLDYKCSKLRGYLEKGTYKGGL